MTAFVLYPVFQCVRNHKGSPCRHHRKGDKISKGKGFTEQDKGQECADEGSNGIAGACFGCPERLLCPDVGEDADPVGDKARQQSIRGIFGGNDAVVYE